MRVRGRKGREKDSSLPLFIRLPVILNQDPTFMNSFKLNHLLRTLSPNTVTVEVRASTYECRRDTIRSIMVGEHQKNNAQNRRKQTIVHGPKSADSPFCMAHDRMIFIFLKDYKQTKLPKIVCDRHCIWLTKPKIFAVWFFTESLPIPGLES